VTFQFIRRDSFSVEAFADHEKISLEDAYQRVFMAGLESCRKLYHLPLPPVPEDVRRRVERELDEYRNRPSLESSGLEVEDDGTRLVVHVGGKLYDDLRKAAKALSRVFAGPSTTPADVFRSYMMDDALTVRGELGRKVADFIDADFAKSPHRAEIGKALDGELKKVGLLEKSARQGD
jgi:hypothetical protein